MTRKNLIPVCVAAFAIAVGGSAYAQSGGNFPMTRIIQDGPSSQALKVMGDAKTCISSRETTWMVIDENNLLFHHDGELYRNELALTCSRARRSGEQQVMLRQALICSGHSLSVPDTDGGQGMAVCHLGDFTPVEIVATP